jgi:ABC-type transport system involved in cytochrome c biogenesis permease subunit
MEIFLFWIVFSFIVGYFASTKSRSGFGWFFFSLFLSPILGLILVAVLPKKAYAESLESQLKAAEAAKNKGLITDEEYVSRRKKIIEG